MYLNINNISCNAGPGFYINTALVMLSVFANIWMLLLLALTNSQVRNLAAAAARTQPTRAGLARLPTQRGHVQSCAGSSSALHAPHPPPLLCLLQWVVDPRTGYEVSAITGRESSVAVAQIAQLGMLW